MPIQDSFGSDPAPVSLWSTLECLRGQLQKFQQSLQPRHLQLFRYGKLSKMSRQPLTASHHLSLRRLEQQPSLRQGGASNSHPWMKRPSRTRLRLYFILADFISTVQPSFHARLRRLPFLLLAIPTRHRRPTGGTASLNSLCIRTTDSPPLAPRLHGRTKLLRRTAPRRSCP